MAHGLPYRNVSLDCFDRSARSVHAKLEEYFHFSLGDLFMSFTAELRRGTPLEEEAVRNQSHDRQFLNDLSSVAAPRIAVLYAWAEVQTGIHRESVNEARLLGPHLPLVRMR
jgi:hypothetical protein